MTGVGSNGQVQQFQGRHECRTVRTLCWASTSSSLACRKPSESSRQHITQPLGLAAAISAPAPQVITVQKATSGSTFMRALSNLDAVYSVRMPMTVYAPSQHNLVAMNTGLPRTPTSPGALSQAPTEVEVPPIDKPLPGWPLLATLIAEKPNLEAFASFTELDIKSLLYYQAELIYLRKALHKAEYEDNRSPNWDNRSSYAGNLNFLIKAREDSFDSAKEEKPEDRLPMPQQWVIMERIRTTLDKYHAALLQFSNITALQDAGSGNVNTLRSLVKKVKENNSLKGEAAQTWGDTLEDTDDSKSLSELFWGLFTGFFVSPDRERQVKEGEFKEHLIVPRKGQKPDGLTLWVTRSFIPFYDPFRTKYLVPFFKPIWSALVVLWNTLVSLWHCRWPKQPRDEEKLSPTTTHSSHSSRSTLLDHFTEYSGHWIVRLTSLITTVVACLLPTVAITILAQVHHMGLILGLIAVFTAVFAVGLVLLSSSSSRVEIFTATAAFSAVMVVFVQNQTNSNSN